MKLSLLNLSDSVRYLYHRIRVWWLCRDAPNHGPCAVCGKPVRHYYPWFTSNPKQGGRPLHDRCVHTHWKEDHP
jgi:hypothetical protein